MQLEDYFDFLAPTDIRLKGHRIGIESILDLYLTEHLAPESIASHFLLSLDLVYATILYYLVNKETVGAYFATWKEYCRQQEEKERFTPSPGTLKLRQILADHAAKASQQTLESRQK